MPRGLVVRRALLATMLLAQAVVALGAAPAFKQVKTVEDLKREVGNAVAGHHPAMLLVRAEWSISGQELERSTLADTEVQTALKDLTLLRADVTNFDAEDKRLLAHLNLSGAPAILFYGADGKEQRNFRGIGFMKAAKLVAVVRLVVGQATPKAQ